MPFPTERQANSTDTNSKLGITTRPEVQVKAASFGFPKLFFGLETVVMVVVGFVGQLGHDLVEVGETIHLLP